MTVTNLKIQRLEQMDEALYQRLDRIRNLISGGEYDHAKMIARLLDDDLDQANRYANKLADKKYK